MTWRAFSKHPRTDMAYTLALLECGGEIVHPVTMLRFEKNNSRFYDALNNMTFDVGDTRLIGWQPKPSVAREIFVRQGLQLSFSPLLKKWLAGTIVAATGVAGLTVNARTNPIDFVFVVAVCLAIVAGVLTIYHYQKFGDPFQ